MDQSKEEMNQAADIGSFESFGLKEALMKGLTEAGFKVPSPIQQKVIPLILAGSDLVGQAHTGTGKTAAFGLPAMNMLELNKGVQMLVITPTRELATQVSDELFRLGSFLGIKTVTIYGGRSFSGQMDAIRRGAQVVVATPGRLLDMLESKRLTNFNPAIVVLDEADEMLDMGFLEDIQKIFTFLPEDRQTLLFSATMPMPIQKLAKEILIQPVFVSVTKQETTNKDIKQHYYVIEEHERDDAVIRLIDCEEPVKSVIFCRTRREVDRVSTALSSKGYPARALHGEMEQSQREEVINQFRSGRVTILVATDVAARGLNVVDISHVFNYHIPFDPESYVHRIGRTGRAGRTGIAITLVTPLEYKEIQRICKTVGTTIEHNYIPTRNDAKKIQVNKMLDLVRRQPLHDGAAEILKALEEEMDLPQIAFKLISKLVEEQGVAGPDQIGLDINRIEKMMQRRPGPERRGGRSFGGGGRPFRSREDRGPRDDRGSRDDRPPRDDRAPRENRAPREGYADRRAPGDRSDRPVSDRPFGDRKGPGEGYVDRRAASDRPANDRPPSDRPFADRRAPSGDRGGFSRGGERSDRGSRGESSERGGRPPFERNFRSNDDAKPRPPRKEFQK